MSDAGNNSMNGSDHSGGSPGNGSRYTGGYRRGYSTKGYHRGGSTGGSGGRYGYYNEAPYSSYNYRGDYYYGAPRYYARRSSNRGGGHRYNHSYMGDYNNSYASGHYYTNRKSSNSSSRYYGNDRASEPWGIVSESSASPLYGKGDNTPTDYYHRNHTNVTAPGTNGNSRGLGNTNENSLLHGNSTSSSSLPSHNIPIATTVKRRVDNNESPFYYLTDLDKSSVEAGELESIRQVFREGDRLDKQLEEHDFSLLKNELELGLLSTQCEKDRLSVQLTQEKLDTFLMQN